MSKIDELIQRLCPDGVPIRPLGELGTFTRGNGIQKKDLTNHGAPAVHYGQIHTRYGTWIDHTVSFVDASLASRHKRAHHGDLLIATTSEDNEAVGKATAWLGPDEVVISGDAYIYHHQLDPKFVSYFFQSSSFQSQKQHALTGTKVRRISGAGLSTIRIPDPPLEVQRVIVDILDSFTKLESELEARRKQYEYYQNIVLSSSSDTAWTTLGDVIDNHDRKRKPVTRINRQGGDYPYYGANGVQDHVDDFIFDGEFLLVGEDGSVKNPDGSPVLNWATGKIWVNNHAHVLTARDARFNLRFLFHYLKTVDISPFVTGGTQPKLNQGNLNQIPVPLLPRVSQDEIVATLDRFDSLVNDLSSGLPAELAARQKQYEYYRDRLLTFKEAA